MEPSKYSALSSSSSSSSSSDDSDEEIAIATLVGLYEANNGLMLEMVRENTRKCKQWGGSVPGRKYYRRERVAGHDRLVADYFSEYPVFSPSVFRRRFRMRRDLFVRILNAIEEHNPYFVQKLDACQVRGLSSLQKMTSSMRMLAYGMPADATDEYLRLGESTTIECFNHFCQSIIEKFGDVYLRSPTADDVSKLLAVGEARGFPGMLGSLDCMHWEWKNCPTAWKGAYCGHVKKPTMILEVVASYDLWIWHAFFGMPGSHNDLNVLDRSPLFDELVQGRAPPANYSINGHAYNMGYYLADGIYPPWATLVQTISSPQGAKKQHFSMMQESTRKDVERAFGVLQARFAIIKGPARFWGRKMLGKIMKTCIILHNMIIEDEGESCTDFTYTSERNQPVAISRERDDNFESFLSRHVGIRNKDAHHTLRNDLVEHLWQRHGEM
ncbi:uncharacterized protein LOC131313964 [Rhododendron vialii]|uniref:uncharacterized protein LOC131313964 n=1 Tax=Rhododendron vialii TaxID=182163 RepID=UPI00265EE9D2|nr:uncharacterized protein LOC131313964 [Rhododendron vialii]